MKNVRIESIKMENVACPIYILLNMRNESKEHYTDEVGENRYWGGSISDVTIRNVHAEGAELPCIITGFETKKKMEHQ